VEIPSVINQLDVHCEERVLDIGSPKLASLYIWYQLRAEVWASDLFPYFVEEYSRYKDSLQKDSPDALYHIEVQDARKLSYPDSFFDKVFAISVVEHIEGSGDSVAMKEIARVLKPGGLCCLTVPAGRSYREATTSQASYYKKPLNGKPVFYQRYYDESALQERLIVPSGLILSNFEQYGERWLRYERLYGRLPRFVKIPISLLGPLFSKLFLYRIRRGSQAEPKTALVLLKKGTLQD
jgi:SAM-dependent methyltransferase